MDLVYGRALKKGDREGGPIPVYGSNGPIGWHDTFLADGPGVIVGRKGNPGTVTWASTAFFPIDTTFYVVSKLGEAGLHFLYQALRGQGLSSLSADSAVPGLNRNLVYMSRQVVPPTYLLEIYASVATDLFKRRNAADQQSQTLAAIRETLLPRLVSGSLRVGGANTAPQSRVPAIPREQLWRRHRGQDMFRSRTGKDE